MLLTNNKGKVVAVTNPDNEKQFIVFPGAKILEVKVEQARKYYTYSILYTNQFYRKEEMPLYSLIERGKIIDGNYTYVLIPE